MERESFAVAREKLEADDIAGAIAAFQDIRNTYPKEDIAEIELALCVCEIYEAILENDDSNLAELAAKLRAAVLACIGNILAGENDNKHYIDADILALLG